MLNIKHLSPKSALSAEIMRENFANKVSFCAVGSPLFSPFSIKRIFSHTYQKISELITPVNITEELMSQS